MNRIEIFRHYPQRGDTVFWDVYVNGQYVSRHNQLCKAKRHAMACQGIDNGNWHKHSRGSHYPLRYQLEA